LSFFLGYITELNILMHCTSIGRLLLFFQSRKKCL
jgi:hypothetical protein